MPGFPTLDERRWLQELEALRARHRRFRLTRVDALATAEGELHGSGGPWKVRLAWPPDFPLRPPAVWELQGEQVRDRRGTRHVWADGSLCLYPHDPEEGWLPSRSAADALDKAAVLLAELSAGRIPTVVPVPHVAPGRVSIAPTLVDALRVAKGPGLLRMRARQDGSFVRIVGAEGGRVLRMVEAEPGREWLDGLALDCQLPGLWARVADPEALVSERALKAALGDTGPIAELLRGARGILVLVGDQMRYAVLGASGPGTANPWASIVYLPVVVEELATALDARVSATLGSDALSTAYVAIIGLGSLGSHVALALARAGVRHFHLVDPNNLAIENVARHACDLRDVGRPKVEAVARALQRLRPGVEVRTVPQLLSLEPRNLDGAVDALNGFFHATGAKLLVCATATAEVEHLVSFLAVEHNLPAVLAAVLGRAQHARVLRVLPGEGPCYACVMHAIHTDPARYARFDEVVEGAYGGGGNPGLGLDVQEVAMLTARMALQTLLRGDGYPDAHGDHILWSRDGTWAVDGPLQARLEVFAKDPACGVCGRRAPLTPEERSRLDRLVGSQDGAVAPS